MSRILGLVLSLGVTAASAQEVCTHAPLITEMSAYVLEQRANLPRLKQARYGDTAAFMAIRYGGVDGITALTQMVETGERPPAMLDDLTGAFLLSQPEGLATWQTGSPATLTRFASLLPSERRALVLADGGETYFQLWNAAMADPEISERMPMMDPFGVQVAFSIADQPEDVRAAIAQRAEDAGALMIAAALLGDLGDRSALDELVARHADAVAFTRFDVIKNMSISTVGVLSREIPLTGARLDDMAGTIRDQQFFTTVKAAMAGQPVDFLMIYMNMSGQMEQSTLAAQNLLDAVEEGEFDPRVDPEAAWLLQYSALLGSGDAGSVRGALIGLTWPSTSVRHFAGSTVQSLDVMVAKDAFGPFVRGEADTLPDQPSAFAGTAEWADWIAAAQAVNADDLTALSPDQIMPAVELLWETGRFDAASTLARDAMDVDGSIAFMSDAMARLDGRCGQYLGLPGGAVRYGGMAVYRFN